MFNCKICKRWLLVLVLLSGAAFFVGHMLGYYRGAALYEEHISRHKKE